MLELGETTVTAIGRLAPHMKGDKGVALIEEAKGKTRREVEQIVAREVTATRVQEVRKAEEQACKTNPSLFAASVPITRLPTPEDSSEFVRREQPDRIVPVSGSDFRIEFIAAAALVKDLEEVRNLLARRFPEARLEEVLGACLQMVLAKYRSTSRPPSGGPQKGGSRTRRPAIPASLRAAVLERDGRRCTFEGAEGRCPVTRRLELDHIAPKALGGEDTLENLRAMCPTHNRFLAKLAFGAAYVEKAMAARRSKPAA